jgi:hypothetical protein
LKAEKKPPVKNGRLERQYRFVGLFVFDAAVAQPNADEDQSATDQHHGGPLFVKQPDAGDDRHDRTQIKEVARFCRPDRSRHVVPKRKA